MSNLKPHLAGLTKTTTILLERCAVLGAPLLAAALIGASCSQDPVSPDNRKVGERWFQSQQYGFPRARPAISSDLVFFASGGGLIIARDVSNGVQRWATQVGVTPHSASPEIGGSNLVLRSGVLVVPVAFHTSGIDATTGEELWRYEAPLDTMFKVAPRPGYVVQAHIDADETTVYIPAWGGTVSAVNLRTGSPGWIWRIESSLSFRSGASGVRVSGDTVFATIWHHVTELGGTAEAWVIALDRASGRELWRVVLPKRGSGLAIACAPVTWRNLVFVTMVNGTLFAMDRNTREIAWQVSSGAPPYGHPPTAVIAGPEVFGDVVYFNGSDQKVHAFHAASGELVWESAVAGQFGSDLLVTERRVYAENGPELLILDRNTGALYARLRHPRKPLDYTFTTSMVSRGAQIFATLTDGAWSFDEP